MYISDLVTIYLAMNRTMEEVHPNLTVVVALYFIIYHLFVTLIVMSFFVAGRNEINVIYRLQIKKNIDKPLKIRQRPNLMVQLFQSSSTISSWMKRPKRSNSLR